MQRYKLSSGLPIMLFSALMNSGLSGHWSFPLFFTSSIHSCRIHGFAASDNAAYFHGHANDTFPDLGLSSLKSQDLCDIVEGYKGQGYGESSQEELSESCGRGGRKLGRLLIYYLSINRIQSIF